MFEQTNQSKEALPVDVVEVTIKRRYEGVEGVLASQHRVAASDPVIGGRLVVGSQSFDLASLDVLVHLEVRAILIAMRRAAERAGQKW